MDSYWQDRAETIFQAGEKSANEMLKSMQKVYKETYSSIEKEINAFYGKYATDNKLSLIEVNKRLNPQELKSAKEEIKRYYDMVDSSKISPNMAKQYKDELRLQSAKAYMSRLEELKLSIQNQLIKLGEKEYVAFSDTLYDIYDDTYNKYSFDIDKYRGFSTGFEQLNTKKIDKALQERWLGENYSDRIWKNKAKLMNELETTFLQGVAQGFNSKKIAQNMAKNMNASYKNCERLARTESGHIMGEASKQNYKDTGVEKYQFIATLDNKTSEICQSLDNEVFLVKEAQEGINYPEMHPNCRSTTIPYFEKDEIDDMFDVAMRSARDENGKVYYVSADTTYKQWKENN